MQDSVMVEEYSKAFGYFIVIDNTVGTIALWFMK